MFETSSVIQIDEETPLLLRRIERKPMIKFVRHKRQRGVVLATHMTVCTTAGMKPEMHDQEEDHYR